MKKLLLTLVVALFAIHPYTTTGNAAEPPLPGFLWVRAQIVFGDVRIFRSSPARQLIIKNIGDLPVSNIQVILRGRQSREFTVGRVPKTTLKGGEAMAVPITFRPWSRARYLIPGRVRSDAQRVSFSLFGFGK